MGRRAEADLPLSPWPESNQTSSPRSGVQVVRLGFEVLRIDLPAGGIRHSRKIWNHVDELRVDSELVVRAARNGIRLGAASAGAWPAIRTILEAADARLHRKQMLPHGDAPIIIELASVGDHESIFHYGKDNRLVGKTFLGGAKAVILDYAYHPELGGCTNIRISLEVRPDQGKREWEPSGSSLGRASLGEGHLFEDLIMVLTLNPGEFLVIGPGDQATNECIIGGRFFTGERAGENYETLLCVTPKPYKTGKR